MIAYKESDVILSWNSGQASRVDEEKSGFDEEVVPPKVCAYVKENGTVATGDDFDEDSDDWRPGESIHSRVKRQATGKAT